MKHPWEARPIWGKIWWHRRVGNNCWRGVPEYLRRHRSGCTWAAEPEPETRAVCPQWEEEKWVWGQMPALVPALLREDGSSFWLPLYSQWNGTQPTVKQREEVLKEGLRRGRQRKASRGAGGESTKKCAITANQHQGPTWGTNGQEFNVSPVSKAGWFCSSLCYPMGVDMRSAESWIQQTWGFAKWMGQTEKTKGIGGICKEELQPDLM